MSIVLGWHDVDRSRLQRHPIDGRDDRELGLAFQELDECAVVVWIHVLGDHIGGGKFTGQDPDELDKCLEPACRAADTDQASQAHAGRPGVA